MSILGNAYFSFIPTSAAHFTLVQENELFPAVMATVLYANVLSENVSTPQKLTTECFCPKKGLGHPRRHRTRCQRGDSRTLPRRKERGRRSLDRV